MAQEVYGLTLHLAGEGGIKMKKMRIKWLFLIFAIFLGMIYILNIKVTTQQGINYQWQAIEIPLYLKVLDFFDRHYNYKWTVKRIIGDSKPVVSGANLTEEERIMKIFKWAHENIKKTPEGYPIIDDHVWHIIVRGYGVDDQSSDVFTTLCNYAGVDAFYSWVYTEDRSSRIPLSFVRIEEQWKVFDPYNGVYFKNKKGNLVNIEEIMKGEWVEESIDKDMKTDVQYKSYLKNLKSIGDMEFKRANTQSPLNRLKYQIKKWLN